MKDTIKRIKDYIKKENVLMISAIAAIVSMFFVPPNRGYVSYLDFRVLSILFCLMAVMKGLQSIGFFEVLSENMIGRINGRRSLCYLLVVICFFSSMWITNDVALITFVPLTILVLTKINLQKDFIFVIVMETIAANLGSMLTPVGNPQNLYLYTYYQLTPASFFRITIPVVILAFLIITFPMLFMTNAAINIDLEAKTTIEHKRKLVCYLGMFLLSLGTVFHVIPYTINLGIIIISILILDKKILKKVDYSLLMTFVCFFILVGNIGQVESIKNWMNHILEGRELILSAVLSQGISNVPAAVLLSTFTDHYKELILGTNIGGLGTIIASLASLISYKQYCGIDGADRVKYLAVFSFINFLFLGVLLGLSQLIFIG